MLTLPAFTLGAVGGKVAGSSTPPPGPVQAGDLLLMTRNGSYAQSSLPTLKGYVNG